MFGFFIGLGFPGFEISLALKATLQITAVNFFLYLAVLPMIMGTTILLSSMVIIANVIVDILYKIIDPRIKLQ